MPSLSDESFDSYAADYEDHLAQGLRLSGESSDYFAQKRIRLVCEVLEMRGESPRSILDYGCGTGNATPFLRKELAPEHIVSVDPSRESIETLKKKYAGPDLTAIPLDEYAPSGDLDACLTNGVFHHIPPRERPKAARIIYDSLRPGGLFFFWENNPWNPATHIVMKLIPFDRNAIKVFPHQARRLLNETGFTTLTTKYHFIFPKILAPLRPLEKLLRNFPLGCQYLVLAEKKCPTLVNSL
jgi:SAM-dependent methyltransferase